VEAVASWHTARLIDRVCVGGNFLVLKEEGSVFKGGEFFKSIEVVFEGSSGQSSGSMGVVLCIWEVVHDRDGGQIANGFEDGGVDIRL
jgi:hypothetical protein